MNYKYLLLVTAFLAFPTAAEIYSWVDENGKTHFGDRAPEQFQDKAEAVQVDVRTPTAEEVKQARKINLEIHKSAEASAQRSEAKRLEAERKYAEAQAESEAEDDYQQHSKPKRSYRNERERKEAEYLRSQACFRRCQVPIPAANGGTILNNAGCGHCEVAEHP